MPVFNEASYITRSLENVVQAKIPGWKKEIIVVNDGSTDDTPALLEKYQRQNREIKIISNPKNLGKGGALKNGIRAATGEITIIQDGDLEYDPGDYTTILKEFEKRDVNVVYGSRILGAKIYHNYNASLIFYLGGITLTKIINQAFGVNLTDQATCYKSWRSSLSEDLIKNCKRNGFEFEVELTAFFARTGKIVEVPIHYYPRTINHGKKINFWDFIKSILVVFSYKLRQSQAG